MKFHKKSMKKISLNNSPKFIFNRWKSPNNC